MPRFSGESQAALSSLNTAETCQTHQCQILRSLLWQSQRSGLSRDVIRREVCRVGFDQRNPKPETRNPKPETDY